MASIALSVIRCIDYLGYGTLFTRAMFLPKKKIEVFLDFFSRQKSPRCSMGGGGPTLRRFSHLFVSDRFWRTAGAFSKTTIFFKLQAGVSLVSSAPPPRLHRARTTPPPHPRRTRIF
jgi:hypothetical protein